MAKAGKTTKFVDTIRDNFDRFLKTSFHTPQRIDRTQEAILWHFFMGGWDTASTLFHETIPTLPTQIAVDVLRAKLRERDKYNEALVRRKAKQKQL